MRMLKSAWIVGVLLIGGAAWAGAPKVTGGISFVNGGLDASASVSVQEAWGNQPDRGTFTYSDANGSYTLDVHCVYIQFSSGISTFAGVVTQSTRTDIPLGSYVQIWLRDNGNPNSGTPDQITGAVSATDPCQGIGLPFPGYWLSATSGNIVNHEQ